ncbi:hypothetical protein BGZ52_008581 [Haplosporangium bisporale]|nr:hypothetical protein BGZ52_008581 [Haplosporangium bisporale]
MDSPLRTYLRDAPRKFGNSLSESAQREINSELYASLWDNNDEYLHNYFPYFVEARQNGVTVLTDNGDDEYSPSARGQACGHTFKLGEGVFRCRTCALDETCVFCLRCFHGTNHEGHDTSFSVNAGGGGCCDCGDSEAWKVDLDCIYHSAKNIPAGEIEVMNLEYPPEVASSIRKTIATVLDFIIDTMTTSPENMNGTRESKEQIQRDAVDAGNIAGETTDLENMQYACILWNDEDHSFTEVIDRVSGATNMPSNYARKIAETVDTQGRAIVEVSSDIPRLMDIANTLAEIQLVSQTIREIICEELCSEWRRKPNKNNTMSHQDTVVEMEDDFIDIDGINPDEDPIVSNSVVDMDGDMDVSGSASESLHNRGSGGDVLDGDSEMLLAAHDEDTPMLDSEALRDQQSADPLAKSARAGPPHRKLRIDWLLLLDLKFWKLPRANLREVYIGTLVLSPKYKKFMAVRFAFNYLKIARAFLVVDREPELSIILFSVQLFTVPTIAEMLAREHNFIYILCQILITFFQGPNYRGGPINCNLPPFKNRRYFHIFHDFRYILANDAVKQIVSNRPSYQTQMMECLNMFQGMHPNTRYSIDHVEFETDTWVNAFNVTLQLYKCCRQFSDCFSSNSKVLTQVLSRTVKKIYEWCDKHEEEMAQNFDQPPTVEQTQNLEQVPPPQTMPGGVTMEGSMDTGNALVPPPIEPQPIKKTLVHTVTMPTTPPISFEVIAYKVSAQPVAFHHPLHWFLADLLENVNFLDRMELQKNGYESFRDMMLQFVGNDQDTPERRLFKLLCVLMAQIKANVWVRNGFVIRTQAQYYREVSLRENTYDSDIFLLQVSMVLFDPELFLATALDRFELLEWFSGQREHTTYDLLQIVFMAEELLTLLIVCVSDRVNTAGFTIEQEIRREIVHGLCLKPIAYSELTKRIPERLTEHVRFDDTLKELASYRAPDGITDHGLYELKDEFFDEVDPYFIHFSRNNSEEAEEILKSRITKKSGNTIKSPQILPRLSRIERGPFTSLGNLMHTKVMTQILFYTFWNVKAEPRIKSDTIIDQAAYIMQIAVLDPNNDSFRSLEQDLAGESTGNGMAGFMRHATFEKFPVIINGNERGATEADSIKTMYLRLAEVFQMNHEDLLSPEEILTHNEHPSQVGQVDIMWEAFAYTISCVEITQRGVNAANGTSTLIAGIQQQNLTLLRMMADTIVSYTSLMVNRPENRVHLAQMSWNRLAKIIQGCPGIGHNEEAALSQIKPLLLEDPFFVLTELVFSSVEPSHLLETLYMVEIAKTIVGLVTTDLSTLVAQEPRISSYCDSSLPALDASNSGILRSVVEFVIKELGVNEQAVASNLSRVPDQLLLKLVRSYTLPFLRKCALLFDARPGAPDMSSAMIGAPSTGTPSNSTLKVPMPIIGLNHPAIYELVGLPRRLDALFEQSIKYICPGCNTVPHDPALCLCCGTIVCSQSFCCLDGVDHEGRGECNTHALTCTGPVGIYLLIKKCVILLLHVRNGNGCFHPAPFLDEHGEADLGLRRGRPQFLNPLRYDDLRRLWLTHGIPIHVARKIEQSYDIGGWRTL